MSFKINRIKTEKESYRTTVDWLNDFSKSANFQDRVKERRDAPAVEKFSTIEDKMKDMKARVGFENLKNITASESKCMVHKYAQKMCDCGQANCQCDKTMKESGETCDKCKSSGCSCDVVIKEDGSSCRICKKK